MTIGACGDDGQQAGTAADRPDHERLVDATANGPRHVVRITDTGYAPARLRIEVGDRISFRNAARRKPHTATYNPHGKIDPSPGDGPTDHSGRDVNYASMRGFATHALFAGEAQTIVFEVARRYRYYCAFHPELRGVVEVVRKPGSR